MAKSDSKFLLIEGGKPLNGAVEISGAKNSALKLIAAALLLGEGQSVIHATPELSDIDVMLEIVRILGGEASFENNSVTINAKDLSSSFVPLSLANKLRASFVCLGALVGRFKEAKIAIPCVSKIGARKVDLQLKGLKAL